MCLKTDFTYKFFTRDGAVKEKTRYSQKFTAQMIIRKFHVPFFKEQSAVMKSFLHMHVPLLQKPFPLHSLGHKEFPIS